MTQIVCSSQRQGLGWIYGPHKVTGEIPDRCPECGMELFNGKKLPLIPKALH